MKTFLSYQTFTEFLNEGTVDTILKRHAELEPFKVTDFDEYVDQYKSMGAKEIGSGSSAEVLQMRNGDVVKIFAAINDPAMVRALSFMLDNQRNVFVPKIRKVMKVWATDEERWMVAIFMEALKPVGGKFKDDIDLLLHSDHSIDDLFWQDLFDIISKNSPNNQKDLKVLISFLKDHMKKYRQMQDFSSQNWMMRGNQLVLIDPFWPDMD